ncbi:hypothetical protein LEP1GSC201_1788 [Leptospira interrogans serovar Pomona str. Fox 32256]|nr:hypothetical protein LEP1GSC201_1114 [Leptospira interrogans serovar Pomona str. Fox 32256]EMF32912.1 hypothetical protein LEP1GSC201_1788 [Leptospira interrogans serovar Pomona str. Fox 32256]
MLSFPTRPIGKRCAEFSNAIHRERCAEFSNAIHRERCAEFSNAIHRERCIEFFLFLGGVVRFGKFFSIRKTYFLQVKRLILVGTLEKCAFLSPERRSVESPFC